MNADRNISIQEFPIMSDLKFGTQDNLLESRKKKNILIFNKLIRILSNELKNRKFFVHMKFT
jgi:hypothetical protein